MPERRKIGNELEYLEFGNLIWKYIRKLKITKKLKNTGVKNKLIILVNNLNLNKVMY